MITKMTKNTITEKKKYDKDGQEKKIINKIPLSHPSFGRNDPVAELDELPFCRDHALDLLLRREVQGTDALEALLEVRLHALGVLRLGQDLQELVVGQEEESARMARTVGWKEGECRGVTGAIG